MTDTDISMIGPANDATCAFKCVAGDASVNKIALCQGDCVQGCVIP